MKCSLIQGNRYCIALTAKVNWEENTLIFMQSIINWLNMQAIRRKAKTFFTLNIVTLELKVIIKKRLAMLLIKACLLHNFIL